MKSIITITIGFVVIIYTIGCVSVTERNADQKISDKINKDAVLKVIRQNKAQIESCYKKSLQKKTNLVGKARFQWEIDSKGKVSNVQVLDNSTGSHVLAQCMGNKLKQFQFDGVDVKSGQVNRVKFPFLIIKK